VGRQPVSHRPPDPCALPRPNRLCPLRPPPTVARLHRRRQRPQGYFELGARSPGTTVPHSVDASPNSESRRAQHIIGASSRTTRSCATCSQQRRTAKTVLRAAPAYPLPRTPQADSTTTPSAEDTPLPYRCSRSLHLQRLQPSEWHITARCAATLAASAGTSDAVKGFSSARSPYAQATSLAIRLSEISTHSASRKSKTSAADIVEADHSCRSSATPLFRRPICSAHAPLSRPRGRTRLHCPVATQHPTLDTDGNTRSSIENRELGNATGGYNVRVPFATVAVPCSSTQ